MIRKYLDCDRVDVVSMWRSLDTSANILSIEGDMMDNELYVGMHNGKVAGFIAYADYPSYREIAALYVKPKYRREGIATELMGYVDSGGYMRLLSNFCYKGAHKFYRSIGYKQTKPIKGNGYFVFTLRADTERKTFIAAFLIGIVAVIYFLVEHILTHKKS